MPILIGSADALFMAAIIVPAIRRPESAPDLKSFIE
jgi:hypothetical protein